METEKNEPQEHRDPQEGGRRKLKGSEIALGAFTILMGLVASYLIVTVYANKFGGAAGFVVVGILLFFAINLIIFIRPKKDKTEKKD